MEALETQCNSLRTRYWVKRVTRGGLRTQMYPLSPISCTGFLRIAKKRRPEAVVHVCHPAEPS